MAFNEYAAYYDVFYKDKDYKAEAKFVTEKIKDLLPGANSILEFGCGTGLHAEYLNKYFPKYRGLDLSEGMVKSAQKRIKTFTYPDDVEFKQGDISESFFDIKVDAVISLFHVMSYQTSDTALKSTISNAAKHLRPGGVFLFDFWYGPAVLEQKPDTRTKEMQDEFFWVSRLATPTHNEQNNTVNIHFDITVKEKLSDETKTLSEDHLMRYFFKDDLEKELLDHGFKLLKHAEFLSDKQSSTETWGTYFLCQFKG